MESTSVHPDAPECQISIPRSREPAPPWRSDLTAIIVPSGDIEPPFVVVSARAVTNTDVTFPASMEPLSSYAICVYLMH